MEPIRAIWLAYYRWTPINPKTHRRSWEVLRRISGLEKVRGVELGVYRGTMSRLLLMGHGGLHLAMVDSWEADGGGYVVDSGDAKARLDADEMTDCQKYAERLTRFAASRREIIRARSQEAASRFDDQSQDFVFIDADHSYEGCKADIDAWKMKVKTGGWLCGHDYDHPNYPMFGVKRAVDEYSEATGLKLELGENYTWFVKMR